MIKKRCRKLGEGEFAISIFDGWCEYTYVARLSASLSIAAVARKIEEPLGRLTRGQHQERPEPQLPLHSAQLRDDHAAEASNV